MKKKFIIFLLPLLIIASCINNEEHNPIEGHWILTEIKVNGLSAQLNACTSQSEIIITATMSDFGKLIRTTYYFDSTKMICKSVVSHEKWSQYNGEYILKDGNIIDSNEGINLTSNDQLVYYYDAWEIPYDEETGQFLPIITTPTRYIYTRAKE
ncbi:MAG: hypothetical protein KIT62_12315 [Cyclobacteriaceae bacterium]|nr:hypothetical protein [Cyclobacteriaceae bacterium]